MPKLVLLSEGLTGRSHELKNEKTTIGRSEDNIFPVQESSVSSHHCEIDLKGSDVVVKDLGSTNGTFINGEKVSEAVLKPGQILRLGQIEIRLESGAPPAGDKKKLDQTSMLPQGVKLNELEQGGRNVSFDKNSPFAKKKDKTNMVFIIVSAVLGLVIIAILIIAFMQM